LARLASLVLIGAVAAAPASAPSRAPDAVGDARALAAENRWQEVADLLHEYLRFSLPSAEVDDLLGTALLKLGRRDEAAHHFERALSQLAPGAREASGVAKRRSEADPLSKRRDGVLQKIASTMAECARQLEAKGHRERALEILERVLPIAAGEERDSIAALVARIRASTEEVDLDRAGGVRPDDGWPAVEIESRRYRLRCRLEPEVAELLGATMDQIFEYYVRIYFDGDEGRIVSQKAAIVIHASHAEMMESWAGAGPTPAGWWSPGDWEVHAYDTRTDSGTLDAMLETLFHEASHHFMTMLAGGGTPAWLNEGTASFFEGAKALADGTVLWPDAAVQRLYGLNEMIHGRAQGPGGRVPTLADVVGWSEPRSYDPEYYPFGWGLVYFFQQYEDPATLEYAYRPRYVAYRDEIIRKGGDARELFERVFFGPGAPQELPTLAAFERVWQRWIQDQVYPLHFGADRRERRMRLVERYLAAAKAASADKKAKVSESELLSRALGHIEYVRSSIDRPDEPDPAIVLLQADVLEKLGRGSSAAPLLEQLIEMAGDGRWPEGEARSEELEKRLAKIDSGNSPLRTARLRARNLARTARALLTEYRTAKTPLVLRSYTFAALASAALDGEAGLAEEAERLRAEARDAGVLRGATYRLAGAEGTWKTIFTNQATAFEAAERRVVLEAVRPVGRLCTAVPLRGEYELRARVTRVGEAKLGAHHGVIVSGTAGGDWLVVTIDHAGKLALKRMHVGSGGGVTDVALTFVDLKQPPPVDAPFDLAVHVFPSGDLEVTVGGDGPYPFRSPLALPAIGYAGVYVKYGRVQLDEPIVEILP
jgi:tetratricopeptide (TPR) repeat protein